MHVEVTNKQAAESEHDASYRQQRVRRLIDIAVSLPVAVLASPLIAVAWFGAAASTRTRGLFRQLRVGRDGIEYDIVKLRTMIPTPAIDSNFTAAGDPRITRFGALLRNWKIDELPQVFQVLVGQMSLVGPRPDVRQVIDAIPEQPRRLVTAVRPGVTGLATAYFRDEELLLSRVADPEEYSLNQILRAKTILNLAYIRNSAARHDVLVLWLTLRNCDLQRVEQLALSLDPSSLDDPVFSEINRLRNGASESRESISLPT